MDRGRSIALAVAAASLVAVVSLVTAGSSAALPKCESASGTTVVANERARIFARRGTLYACAAGSRRTIELGPRFSAGECFSPNDCSGSGIRTVRLTRRFAAYVEARTTTDAATSAIRVVDIRQRTERNVWREGSLNSTESVGVPDIELASDGSIAWLAIRGPRGTTSTNFTRRVLASTRGAAPVVLDEGGGIELGSLALAGKLVYWTNAGAPRSAAIE